MKRFVIPSKLTASVYDMLDGDILGKLWRGFTFTVSELSVSKERKLPQIVIGDAAVPTLPRGAEYAYHVGERGVGITAENKQALMRGFFDLIMQVEYTHDGGLYIRECDGQSSFIFKNRMIHICIFAQTKMLDLKKLVRLAASVGYTHAVLEFWGTFPYECEKGLAWDEAYSKDEIRELVSEMRALGVLPIPMINHLGHAASGRVTGGKHAVLDRAPWLYKYFTPDGWSWDISSPYTRALLKEMRKEQYEVFGECEYFHLGLDEAYMYATSEKHRNALPEYLSYITNEVVNEGVRPMIWMDMFLPADSGTKHICTCNDKSDMEKALSALNKKTVLVDWEYNFTTIPMPTTDYIVKSGTGFDVMCAPWTNPANFKAAIDTVKTLSTFGFMMTTWHTMAKKMSSVLEAARAFGAPKAPWSDFSGSVEGAREECATLLRKLSFEGITTYRESGWCDEEITLSIGEIG